MLAFAAGCGGAPPDPTPTPAAAAVSSTLAAETQPAKPAASVVPPATLAAPPVETPEGTFTNPVMDSDFPDPDVLLAGDTYYAYATNGNGLNIQAARSTDLVNWTRLPDALPSRPAWAVGSFGWVWAPEVFALPGSQGYRMYFVARYAIGSDGVQCIGVASSALPEGPFEPQGEEPLICQTDAGGSIDPASFEEDGRRFVLWKNDGNSIGGQSWIYIQETSADGLALQGQPVRLLTADLAWEGILVEAPTLWKHDGRYYLFYSANLYNTPRYAVGYAVADEIFGPYTKAEAPLLQMNIGAGLVGTGGQDIVTGPGGGLWLLFHGWAPEGYRRLYLAPLVFEDGVPRAALEGRDPLPMP